MTPQDDHTGPEPEKRVPEETGGAELDAEETGNQRLSPGDEAEVRRLLAAAGGPVATPDHVAARLDGALDDLLTERDTGHHSQRATTAHGSRTWPKLLVAAAAVGVIGLGIGTALQGTGGSADSASSADVARVQAGGAAELAPSQGPASSPGSGDEATGRSAQSPSLLADALASLPRVRAESALGDAQRIYDLSLGVPAPPATASGGGGAEVDGSQRTRLRGCELPPVGRGERLVAVRFEGDPATLLFAPAQDGRRRASVYPCDDSRSPVLVTRIRAR